ncbi:monomethylamine:corrinoid methyltransferase [Candidatus Formimonas warabiya]|uniref:Monomethylamine:corrinoid methyltransferase n=1 Tax=Formimonas warabiya TaxID=1761012 RepID=A0A3G1KQA8_FORW1|nr:monomethylamine:corrinoid methyltransferase [Candidatus Formimonas warabiya]ATW24628.1 hypothetical protein DCMF_07385 [Candidatus Formimonas warabiya]
MASLVYLTEILKRTKNGPNYTAKEWEQKVIPQNVRAILKKYDLEKRFNSETPINQDLALADQFFQAGLDLASTIGVLCTDTETAIMVSREEILTALKNAPAALELGEGQDRVTLKARKPEDSDPPLFCGSLSIAIDEDLYVKFVEGMIRNHNVNLLQGPSIDTVFGAPVYAGTPFETLAGLRENQLRAEALWKAGRSGMPNCPVSSSTTEFGILGGFPGQTKPSNRSIAVCLQPAELKTNYSNFNKVVVAIGYNGYVRSGCPSMIGGYSGSAEGAAVANIASDLMQFTINQADISNCSLYDVRINSAVGRHALWAQSIALQAMSHNTHGMLDKIINQTAGPCTEEILYATTAGLITQAVSGISMTTGPRSAGGSYKNYITPLEHWFCADAFKACGGLTLAKSNEIVLYLLSKYEDNIRNQPKGKSFRECFDIETLTPSPEWQAIAHKVKEDLLARGLKME